MNKNRIEAFSDRVLAIIITIMVLEMKAPAHASHFSDLQPLLPVFLSYVLSFLYLGIYWNNHHHLLHATERSSGGIMWANLHLLFWLSLIPLRHRVDGGESLRTDADSPLWRGAPCCRNRVCDSAEGYHSSPRRGFGLGARHRA